jgi:hypothetical protein
VKLAPYLALLAASPAHAEPLALELEGCPAPFTSALFEALGLELVDEAVALVEGPAESRIAVRCIDDTALVDVTATLRGQRQTTTVALSDVAPEHRARTLALTVAERYRGWVLATPPARTPPPEPPPEPRPEPARPEPPAPEPTRSEPPAPEPRPEPAPLEPHPTLSAALALTTWPSSFYLLGPRIDLGLPLSELLTLDLALDAGFATTNTTPGEVSSWTLGLTFGLGFGVSDDELAWAVGPRINVAALSLSGRTDASDQVARSGIAPVMALGVGAELHLFVADDWFIGLGLEAMMTALGVRATATGTTVLEATGARLGASLGLGHRF